MLEVLFKWKKKRNVVFFFISFGLFFLVTTIGHLPQSKPIVCICLSHTHINKLSKALFFNVFSFPSPACLCHKYFIQIQSMTFIKKSSDFFSVGYILASI